jgi:hypothetical protein
LHAAFSSTATFFTPSITVTLSVQALQGQREFCIKSHPCAGQESNLRLQRASVCCDFAKLNVHFGKCCCCSGTAAAAAAEQCCCCSSVKNRAALERH